MPPMNIQRPPREKSTPSPQADVLTTAKTRSHFEHPCWHVLVSPRFGCCWLSSCVRRTLPSSQSPWIDYNDRAEKNVSRPPTKNTFFVVSCQALHGNKKTAAVLNLRGRNRRLSFRSEACRGGKQLEHLKLSFNT